MMKKKKTSLKKICKNLDIDWWKGIVLLRLYKEGRIK